MGYNWCQNCEVYILYICGPLHYLPGYLRGSRYRCCPNGGVWGRVGNSKIDSQWMIIFFSAFFFGGDSNHAKFKSIVFLSDFPSKSV